MATKIKQLAPDRYTVNGKLVHQDMDGDWIGNPEMTTQEVSHFQRQIMIVKTPPPCKSPASGGEQEGCII